MSVNTEVKSVFDAAVEFEVCRFAHFSQHAYIQPFQDAVQGVVVDGVIQLVALRSAKDNTSQEVYDAIHHVVDKVLESTRLSAQPA